MEFANVGFHGEGKKPEYLEKKKIEASERTNNKLNPHMVSTPGFESAKIRLARRHFSHVIFFPFINIVNLFKCIDQSSVLWVSPWLGRLVDHSLAYMFMFQVKFDFRLNIFNLG